MPPRKFGRTWLDKCGLAWHLICFRRICRVEEDRNFAVSVKRRGSFLAVDSWIFATQAGLFSRLQRVRGALKPAIVLEWSDFYTP